MSDDFLSKSTLRENWWEMFPDLIFFDEPICDESICGLALVDDGGPSWAVAYDYEDVMQRLVEYFSDSEDQDEDYDPELSAEEWFSYNTIGSYVGAATPVFMGLDSDRALRFSLEYDKVVRFQDVASMEEVVELLGNSGCLFFVDLEHVDRIKDLA